eukprot:CAMPEP_0119545974 /NCGR_PEP_ID=MMETSP1352-20130426/568_1 /TAXON_ID=265584 /ORGANISM="Stauroneis constricta, Strain CCMP1120" /LENGTH=363 /DNA_ID=CAMNT_0007590613 /DNA_START=92 /DNA_END=1183 /DNA_ORIENTATION=+
MAELFTPKQLEDDPEEDWHFYLTGSFADLATKGGWTFEELFAYVDEDGRVAWTGDECCVLPTDMDPPEHHESYTITMMIEDAVVMSGADGDDDGNDKDKPKKRKLSITAPNSEHAASTIEGIFLLCARNQTPLNVAFKLFATNPRQKFPTVSKEAMQAAVGDGIQSLSFQFCALDQTTIQAVSEKIGDLELRQSVVDGGWEASLSSESSAISTLKLSCTQPEFVKIIPSLGSSQKVETLELLLHFWLQGDWFRQFCNDALKSSKSKIKSLTISYLDINDDGWSMLLESLHHHPTLETLDLCFTEKFVDTFRRLDAERRTKRTEAVLKLVEANATIKTIVWPDFQQDAEIMKDVTAKLEQRILK